MQVQLCGLQVAIVVGAHRIAMPTACLPITHTLLALHLARHRKQCSKPLNHHRRFCPLGLDLLFEGQLLA